MGRIGDVVGCVSCLNESERTKHQPPNPFHKDMKMESTVFNYILLGGLLLCLIGNFESWIQDKREQAQDDDRESQYLRDLYDMSEVYYDERK